MAPPSSPPPPRTAHPKDRAVLAWMAILAALGDRVRTPTQVARALGRDRSGTSRHLRALEAEGLVMRVTAPSRWSRYRVTTRGSRWLAAQAPRPPAAAPAPPPDDRDGAGD